MDYSKCWLDYQPVDTVEKEWLTYFQSCEGEIVESAVSEYKLAMENMAGKVPQPVTKEEAGVVFSVDSSIKEGKDGYIITKEESRYRLPVSRRDDCYMVCSIFFVYSDQTDELSSGLQYTGNAASHDESLG